MLDWSTLVSTVVGGLLAVGGSFVAGWYQIKSLREQREFEKKQYIVEKRESVYLELAGVLADIPVPIDGLTRNVDTDSLEKHLQAIADVIEKNKNTMALYASRDIQNELLHLNADIYSIIRDEEKQKIDFSSRETINNSPIFKVVKYAETILLKLRKEVGV